MWPRDHSRVSLLILHRRFYTPPDLHTIQNCDAFVIFVAYKNVSGIRVDPLSPRRGIISEP